MIIDSSDLSDSSDSSDYMLQVASYKQTENQIHKNREKKFVSPVPRIAWRGRR